MAVTSHPAVRLGTTLAALILASAGAFAAVLPEDRIDVMYHGYDGGGLEVGGPSVLVRKSVADKISVWGNYYVDSVTSASIDVVTTASEYTEERKERSAGVDYLHGKTALGLSYMNSSEGDYKSNAIRFGITQDFFGDLTNVGIAYARGWDTITRNGDETFEEKATHQSYRLDVSQIITSSLVLSLNYEGITDEGFLNNPYRQVRFRDPSAALGYSYEAERYPGTRTSSAVALRGMLYMPYRAALKLETRYYTDTWGIEAYNGELAYTHPFDNGLTVDLRYRYYEQSAADFYGDLFERSNEQNFIARDKEMASFQTHTAGLGVTYKFNTPWLPFVDRGQVSLFGDYIRFQYDDFRDVRVTGTAAGAEPLYDFDAIVLRAFVSFFI
ncbi:MAG: DUF3570 domain-containing protein [Pseudomonadota bacterium]